MKWSALAVPVIFLIYILVIINYNNFRIEEFDAIKQREYDINVNYAVDAAIEEAMRQAMDSGIDYMNIYSITLEPSFAVDVYCECMLRALGWSVTDENKAILLDNYTPYFLVVENNGYYIMSRTKYLTSMTLSTGSVIDDILSYPLMWGPKKPFCELEETGGKRYLHIYTLQDDVYTRYDVDTHTYEDEFPYTDTGVNKYGTLGRRNTVIANTLNADVNQAILAYSAQNGVTLDCTFSLPTTDTDYVKAVTRPSIYTMFVDTRTLTGEPIVAVGGARVEVSPGIIAYERGGRKLYTYARHREDVEKTCTILDIFSDMVSAAKAGYYPDTLYLQGR